MPVFTNRFSSVPSPTPAFPDGLQLAGPVVAVQVGVPDLLAKFLSDKGQPVPPSATGLALIDTGATMSAVNEQTVTSLGVKPVGTVMVGTAGGPKLQPLFAVKAFLPQPSLTVNYAQVTGADLAGHSIMGQPIIMLIGRDVLRTAILVYDGPSGQFTLAY